MSIKRTPELTALFVGEYASNRAALRKRYATSEAYVDARYANLDERRAEALRAPRTGPIEPSFKW